MREYKFRAWDKAYNKMFDVVELSYDGNALLAWREPYEGEAVPWSKGGLEVGKECVLMQCTGLKDKNGKEIYEGDIVKGESRIFNKSIIHEVTFLNGCYMFGGWNAHEYFNKHTNIEVISTIHENPELLGGAK